MSGYFTHEFESTIEEFGVGKTRKVWYRVVFLPPELEGDLPFGRYPRLRVDAEIADVPVNNAFMPTGDGRRYLIVSPQVLKSGDVGLGDLVTVRFRIGDQDHVDVPQALDRALRAHKQALAVWDSLTPGKRRRLAFHVAGAKTAPTAQRRVDEVMAALTDHAGELRR